MPNPNVSINPLQSNLGTLENAPQGVSLLVVGLPTGLEGVVYEGKAYGSLKEFEDDGFNQAFDLANDILFWEHVKQYFQNSRSLLHVLPVGDTVSVTEMFTVGNSEYTKINEYLTAQNGTIKLVAVAVNPPSEIIGTVNYAQTSDLITAIPLAQAFSLKHSTEQRHFLVFLECRKFTASVGAAPDLRNLGNNNRVAVYPCVDLVRKAQLIDNPQAVEYADIGYFLGFISKIDIYKPSWDSTLGSLVGINDAGFSGGQAIKKLSDVTMSAYADKGYCCMVQIVGLAGWYFGETYTCVPTTNDFHTINRWRVMFAAMSAAYQVLITSLTTAEVDEGTGQMSQNEKTALELETVNAINQLLNNPNFKAIQAVQAEVISGNLITTKSITVNISILPLGEIKYITANIGYVSTLTTT